MSALIFNYAMDLNKEIRKETKLGLWIASKGNKAIKCLSCEKNRKPAICEREHEIICSACGSKRSRCTQCLYSEMSVEHGLTFPEWKQIHKQRTTGKTSKLEEEAILATNSVLKKLEQFKVSDNESTEDLIGFVEIMDEHLQLKEHAEVEAEKKLIKTTKRKQDEELEECEDSDCSCEDECEDSDCSHEDDSDSENDNGKSEVEEKLEKKKRNLKAKKTISKSKKSKPTPKVQQRKWTDEQLLAMLSKKK